MRTRAARIRRRRSAWVRASGWSLDLKNIMPTADTDHVEPQ